MRPLPTNSPVVIIMPKKKLPLKYAYYEYYQTNNHALLGRLFVHILQFLIVNILVFWYLPNTGNVHFNNHPECRSLDIESGKCNEPATNPFLLIFYIFYCAYFAFSAMQIRHGWPEMEESLIMKPSDPVSKVTAKVFYAIPFAWELQQIASWLWTKTSFDLFQWLKFEEIYNNIFLVKCSAKAKEGNEIGTEVSVITKHLIGGTGLFILILLIIGPILVFSTLNPMTNLNNLVKSSLVIKLDYGVSESFELMSISNAALSNVSQEEFDMNEMREFDEIRGEGIEQFQWATFANSSDYNNFPTETKRLGLVEYFEQSSPYARLNVLLSFSRRVFPFNAFISTTL